MDKLNINNEMAEFDSKSRGFYDSLTEEERKKFSNYLMIRWGSAVQGDSDLQEYYLRSCNLRLNKDFFAINKHPKLQWLCATTVSPGIGKFKHQWIAPKKKETGTTTVKKALMEKMPTMKISDIETLARLATEKEVKQWIKEYGQE